MNKIDFVVTWVDGGDPIWQAKKAKYSGAVDTSKNSMNSVKAYRDWGTFKYWFRGVEKFAPWVNKVYLVTDQQKPSWLDINSEKLVLVDHTEIICNDYLPVFSANPIESNIHRIPGLSEHFVFFNESPLYTYILIFLNTIQYIPNCVHIYNTNTTYSIYGFFIN